MDFGKVRIGAHFQMEICFLSEIFVFSWAFVHMNFMGYIFRTFQISSPITIVINIF
jgi:hypothetical protein